MGSPRQVAALLLAIVVIGSSIPIGFAGPATAAPPGFVGVPGEQVEKSNATIKLANPPSGKLPDHAGPPNHVLDKIPNDALDHVLADKHASTTTVQFATTKAGTLALVATDDTFHEGRTIAVPLSALEESLGYVPRLAYGIHEDGDRWRTSIEIADGYALIEVPRFSTNTVTFAGRVELDGTPSADGDQFTYDVTDLDAVENITTTITGTINSEWDNETGTAIEPGGATASTSPAGNLAPTGPSANDKPEIEIEGIVNSSGHFDSYASQDTLWGNESGTPVKSEARIDNPPPEIDKIRVAMFEGDASGTVDIYIVEEEPDGVYGEGTLVKSGYAPTGESGQNINISKYTPSATTITIEFVSNDDWNADDTADVKLDGHASGTWQSTDGNTRSNQASVWARDHPENVTVSDGQGNTATFGDFWTNRGNKTRELDLSLSSTTLTFNGSGGTLDYTLRFEERTETEDVAIEVNNGSGSGGWMNRSGTLSDGTSATLSPSSSWIQTGTNYVNVTVDSDGSLTSDAPTPQVTVDYDHRAVDDQSVSFTAEEWTESYNVSRTWSSDQSAANLTIPFNSGEVVEIRTAEKRVNGGSWSAVASGDQTLSGTTLTVDLGGVSANDKIEVRVDGSKVKTHNVTITVQEATTAGDSLNTKIKLDTHKTGAYIETNSSDARLEYLHSESWSSPAYYLEVTESGRQRLHLSNAGAGETVRISRLEIEPTVDSGEARIDVVTAGSEPELDVDPGASTGNQITFKLTDSFTTSGITYELKDVTNGKVVDRGTASSPLNLTALDDDRNLKILNNEGSSSSSSGSGGGGGGGSSSVIVSTDGPLSSLPVVLIVAVAVVAIVGFGANRFIDDDMVVLALTSAAALIVLVLAGEGISPGVLLGPVGEGVGQVTPVLALGAGALVLYWAYRRFIKGQEPPTIQIRGRVK